MFHNHGGGVVGAHDKVHAEPRRRKVAEHQARGLAAPPVRMRGRGVRQEVAVAGRRVALIVEVFGVSAVAIPFQMPLVVGLDERGFKVVMRGVRVEVDLAVVPQLVNVPHGNAGTGKRTVVVGFVAGLDEEVFPGRPGLGEAVEGVEIRAGLGVDGGDETGGQVEVNRGGPAGGALEIGAYLRRIVAGVGGAAAPGAARHQAPITHSGRPPGVVIEVGVVAQHVPVLVNKGADGQFVADVGDLIKINPFAARGQLDRAGEHPRMRPQPVAPAPAVVASVKNVQSQDPVLRVGAERGEGGENLTVVVRQGLHGFEGVFNEQAALLTGILAGVVVGGFGFGGADVNGHHVGVSQLPVGVVSEVGFDRPVVAVTGIIVAIAEVEDFGLGHGGHVVLEINQQSQPDFQAHRGPAGRGEGGAVGGGQGQGLFARLPAFGNSHALVPARESRRRLLRHGVGADAQVGLETQALRIAKMNLHAGGKQLAAILRKAGIAIGHEPLVKDNRVAVEGFENGMKFIPLAPQADGGAVGLAKRDFF